MPPRVGKSSGQNNVEDLMPTHQKDILKALSNFLNDDTGAQKYDGNIMIKEGTKLDQMSDRGTHTPLRGNGNNNDILSEN